MRFSDAIKEFDKSRNLSTEKLTNSGYKNYLLNFCVFVRNPMITMVKYEDVMAYLQLQEELGWNRRSIQSKSIAIKMFFEFWNNKGYPVFNTKLIPSIKIKFRMPRVSSDEDLEKFITLIPTNNNALNKRTKAIVLMLADSGARLGEIASLNLNDLDKNCAIIKTEKSRGKNPFRKIFWGESAQEALNDWLEARKNLKYKHPEAVFISTHQAHKGSRVDRQSLGRVFKRISDKNNLPKTFNAHSLRHRFGRELARNGANNSTISNLMGHQDINSSMIYTMMDGTEMQEAHKKYKKS
jgi:integrase/recombinase XerC